MSRAARYLLVILGAWLGAIVGAFVALPPTERKRYPTPPPIDAGAVEVAPVGVDELRGSVDYYDLPRSVSPR